MNSVFLLLQVLSSLFVASTLGSANNARAMVCASWKICANVCNECNVFLQFQRVVQTEGLPLLQRIAQAVGDGAWPRSCALRWSFALISQVTVVVSGRTGKSPGDFSGRRDQPPRDRRPCSLAPSSSGRLYNPLITESIDGQGWIPRVFNATRSIEA